jgi:hypothetical protein
MASMQRGNLAQIGGDIGEVCRLQLGIVYINQPLTGK